MTSVTDDPGLGLWLRWAESGGALSEDAGDHALVVLPPALQDRCDLPEEVGVTSDPDVAREDGALLLTAGHPLLDDAAAAVLERGDAGHAHLPWPRPVPPSAGTLLDRARERFPVDHGRIDLAGRPPALVYAPVLRVGVLVTYAASLDLRFQEREEGWVDAMTGLELDERARRALHACPRLAAADTAHPRLAPDLGRALRGADALLRARAAVRQRDLAEQAARSRRDELALADAYYDALLASLAKRRAAATDDDRRRLLDAQAEATRTERVRRRAEIDEQHLASHEIRPVRLHLLGVPAVRLPVTVRRGARTYPFSLVWLLPAASFAPAPCPECGADAPLVAGRERLGCELCGRTFATRRRGKDRATI